MKCDHSDNALTCVVCELKANIEHAHVCVDGQVSHLETVVCHAFGYACGACGKDWIDPGSATIVGPSPLRMSYWSDFLRSWFQHPVWLDCQDDIGKAGSYVAFEYAE